MAQVWTSLPDMPQERIWHTMAATPDGKKLVCAGGEGANGTALKSVVVFDVSTRILWAVRCDRTRVQLNACERVRMIGIWLKRRSRLCSGLQGAFATLGNEPRAGCLPRATSRAPRSSGAIKPSSMSDATIASEKWSYLMVPLPPA